MSGIEISEDEFNSLLRLITDGKAQAAAVIQEIFDYFGEKTMHQLVRNCWPKSFS